MMALPLRLTLYRFLVFVKAVTAPSRPAIATQTPSSPRGRISFSCSCHDHGHGSSHGHRSRTVRTERPLMNSFPNAPSPARTFCDLNYPFLEATLLKLPTLLRHQTSGIKKTNLQDSTSSHRT
ncbi:hypothetical protein J3F83DRAFT_747283 [Trichoderma novae-zelandiae]